MERLQADDLMAMQHSSVQGVSNNVIHFVITHEPHPRTVDTLHKDL